MHRRKENLGSLYEIIHVNSHPLDQFNLIELTLDHSLNDVHLERDPRRVARSGSGKTWTIYHTLFWPEDKAVGTKVKIRRNSPCQSTKWSWRTQK